MYLPVHSPFVKLVACLAAILLSACTVKHEPIQTGMIPKVNTTSPGEQQHGQRLLNALCDDYKIDTCHPRYNQLVDVFDKLIKSAEVDHLSWHLHLFDEPEIADVRAVHGNYIFVWSGFLDIVESEDEIAGVLACEMAHALARHPEPVKFTLWADIFFDVAEMATSIAIFHFSHGVAAVSPRGWMKWAYVHIADLDPLDRTYQLDYEKEAMSIGLLLISRAKYSPESLIEFWSRLDNSNAYNGLKIRLIRNVSPLERVAIIEEILPTIAEFSGKISAR